ncbi:hypothetical protein [Ligilactobacillus sp. Marseille-Q7487]|jgi:hypothetical protein|uniref:hypothetical protein n=1 Tax=Ligilactobacillus sp. Marseille-Q7487 TaxID=3022128 RepID=UPI0015B51A80|nr:hypothetical protein [Ligilactobacillus sp. Marseille-Q7487]
MKNKFLASTQRFFDSALNYLENFFVLTPSSSPKQMPEFQIRFCVQQAIKQNKPVKLHVICPSNQIELISGYLTKGPTNEVFLMQQAHSTRIIFLNQIHYLQLVSPSSLSVKHALKSCS